MSKHTPGPWEAFTMTVNGSLPTAEEFGEYCKSSMLVALGTPNYSSVLFVSVEKPDGPSDVCIVGNGPDGPANARLIAAAPLLLEALLHCREQIGKHGVKDRMIDAAITAATGEGDSDE